MPRQSEIQHWCQPSLMQYLDGSATGNNTSAPRNKTHTNPNSIDTLVAQQQELLQKHGLREATCYTAPAPYST